MQHSAKPLVKHMFRKTVLFGWVTRGKASRKKSMSEETFNMSMRKFLKQVGVTSQQEIERIVRDSNLAGQTNLKVKVVLTAEGTDLNHVVDGNIELG